MSEFAKIVVAPDGAQVLFFKDEGDEGPELAQITRMHGFTAKISLGFDNNAEGCRLRDEAFIKAGIVRAKAVRDMVQAMVQKSQDEMEGGQP